MTSKVMVLAVFVAHLVIPSFPFTCPAFANNDAGITYNQQQSIDAQVALQGMAFTLKSVRSGTCSMQCQYQYGPNHKGEGKLKVTGENLFIAFDKDKYLYRYDQLETRYSGRPDQIIVLPDVVLLTPGDWTKKSGSNPRRLVIRKSRSDVDNPFQGDRDPFVTVFADCQSSKMHESQAGNLDSILNKMLEESTLFRYENEKGNRIRIVLRHKSPQSKVTVERDLTLDTSMGYVPIRLLVRHDGTKSGEWTEPDVIETKWKPSNEVYVPTRTIASGTTYRQSVLTFVMKWEHVNEALDATLFTEEAFSLKSGDLMAVANRESIIVEKIVGVDLPEMHRSQVPPTDLRPRMAVLLLVHAALIGGWFYYRRRRKRNSTAQRV